MNDFRIGHGFDVHRFSEQPDPDKPLVLAGVTLPDSLSVLAHSDGDVVLHAVCDAILGAIGAGDIGSHFPDDDPQWAGADSKKLLARVLDLAASKRYRVGNVDVTVIAEVPKLAPHREALHRSLADALGVDSERLNLKATTTEKLGAIGRAEGIACHAVVLMQSIG